ncbi:MAG TPA: hypothetical protein DG753_08935 [Clostridium sp.]|nr:hypothetical protein [Clostridium sp.]
MYIKKEGSALISSVMVLSLISLLGCMYYKMTNYSIQLEALNYIHSDRYNIDREEEAVIYKFMKLINKKIQESQVDEEDFDIKEVLRTIKLPSVNKSIINYNIETQRFILKYCAENKSERYRDIDYEIKDNKVILIPGYIFEEKNVRYD